MSGRQDDRRRPQDDRLRINHRIRVPQVRVVGDDSEQLGVMLIHEALRLAEERGVDLVEISPRAIPPVCRLMDYGKFKFEQSKKKKPASSGGEVKEIKLRPTTEEHDLSFKTKHARRFLEEGHKVRLVVVFRGRELAHPETGKVVITKVVDALGDLGNVETPPWMENRRMTAVIAPRSKSAKKPPPAATTSP